MDKNLDEYLSMKRNTDTCDHENFLCEEVLIDSYDKMHNQSMSYYDYAKRGLSNKLKIWKPNKFKDSKVLAERKPSVPGLQ